MKEDKRPEAVKKFQEYLKVFRIVVRMDGQELGNILGCTKQNIYNIESGRIVMSIPQYIAIRTIFEHLNNNAFNSAVHELIDDGDEYWLDALIKLTTETNE